MSIRSNDAISFYEDLDNLKELCNFLRSSDGPAVREAIEMDKRVYYLKGEKLVSFMVEPRKGTKWPKKLPKFKTRQEATAVCKELCNYQFMHRSIKRGKGDLVISRDREFDESAIFTWIYEGDKSFSHLMTTLLIMGFLFCVCFPIWPNFLKVFAWYMSVSFLLLIFFLVTLRGLLFLFVWIIGYDFWFLPNLFDEQLGFIDSFKPLYSFDKTKEGQLMYRVSIAVAFSSFCWWAVTQPSEFDGFIKGNEDFIKDLYHGRLLTDISQTDKENIDKPKMDSLEDLLAKLDESLDDPEDAALFDEEVMSDEEQLDRMMDSLIEIEEEVTDED